MKTSTLKDALTNRSPATQEAPPPAAPAAEQSAGFYPPISPDIVAKIEIEAVVGGALQRITFAAGINPASVKGFLLALDPAAKVRDDFPSRNFGNGKNTKTARAMMLTLRITPSGKFCDLACRNGDDIMVSVPRKLSDGFPDSLATLNRLTPGNLDKVRKAYKDQSTAVVILSEAEQFCVHYWTSDDGKSFLESLTAEPPAPIEKEAVA